MTNPSGDSPAGWYPAQGDPPGTHRYWDGRQWVGGPMPIHGPPGYGTSDQGSSRDHLPDIGRQLASPWQRIGAVLLDGLILAVPVVVVMLAFFASSDDLEDFENFALPFAAIGALYEIGFIALRGATPGKMVVGIEVVTQEGASPPGWGTASLRYLTSLLGLVPVIGWLVSSIVELASLILLFADDRRRTVHDRIASTYVVRRR